MLSNSVLLVEKTRTAREAFGDDVAAYLVRGFDPSSSVWTARLVEDKIAIDDGILLFGRFVFVRDERALKRAIYERLWIGEKAIWVDERGRTLPSQYRITRSTDDILMSNRVDGWMSKPYYRPNGTDVYLRMGPSFNLRNASSFINEWREIGMRDFFEITSVFREPNTDMDFDFKGRTICVARFDDEATAALFMLSIADGHSPVTGIRFLPGYAEPRTSSFDRS